ncbi:MAG: DUF3426 domain-containing protein [Deltaproteobacteria bacterium]|nr:DUF3426 domain-containing protein [Deltaproteobacteria bacterium]
MIVTCLNCNSNFKLDDNLVKPTGSTVKCSTCKNIFVIYKDVSQDLVKEDVEIEESFPESDSSDFDVSGIQVDFDDDIKEQDENVDLEDIDLASEFDVESDSDLDLAEIQIDFDEAGNEEVDEDFDLPDMDSDFDLPDMDAVELPDMDAVELPDMDAVDLPDMDEKSEDLELSDDDLSDFDLDDIAGDLDTSQDEEKSDIDFDLSLDEEDLSDMEDAFEEEDNKNDFLEATDYDQDDESDNWNVDLGKHKKKKKKKGGCLLILLTMLFVVALTSGGVYYAVHKKIIDINTIKFPSFINNIFKLDPMGKTNFKISKTNRYIINKHEDKLFVIEGKITNNYKDIRKYIKVVGKILDKDNTVLSDKVVYCGNVISDIDLANYKMEEIESKLNNKNGADEYIDGIKPGAIIPFMVVFSDLPENMKRFSVETVSSNIE